MVILLWTVVLREAITVKFVCTSRLAWENLHLPSSEFRITLLLMYNNFDYATNSICDHVASRGWPECSNMNCWNMTLTSYWPCTFKVKGQLLCSSKKKNKTLGGYHCNFVIMSFHHSHNGSVTLSYSLSMLFIFGRWDLNRSYLLFK